MQKLFLFLFFYIHSGEGEVRFEITQIKLQNMPLPQITPY